MERTKRERQGKPHPAGVDRSPDERRQATGTCVLEVGASETGQELDPATFKKFCSLIYERSGITLGAGKEALISARVRKRMRALGIVDFKSYLHRVTEDITGEEIVHLLDAISTNVTHFFREPDHFVALEEAFSRWLAEGQRRFRIWSAACSSGEEPYSIAMTLLAKLGDARADIRVLATDISTRMLEKAIAGVYGDQELSTVPAAYRERFFDRTGTRERRRWTVRKELRNVVAFERLNLAAPPFPMRGPFDAIFCRNVMIYFDMEIRRPLIAEIERLCKPGGHLMLGHSESLMGISSAFTSWRPTVYTKVDTARKRP